MHIGMKDAVIKRAREEALHDFTGNLYAVEFWVG